MGARAMIHAATVKDNSTNPKGQHTIRELHPQYTSLVQNKIHQHVVVLCAANWN